MLLKISILLCGITCALGAIVPEDKVGVAIPEDRVALINDRVHGGSTDNITTCPFLVSIQYNFGGHICDGSIYSKDLVITTASCLMLLKPSIIKVRAGSNTWDCGGTLVPVSEIRVHQYFDPTTAEANIALMKLATPLIFGDKIQPIPIGTTLVPANTSATVFGWGASKWGGSTPKQLMTANVTIFNWTQCTSEEYGYGTKILGGMFCAAGTGKSGCNGDSGGPLISNGILVGIFSWGFGCGEPLYPSVITSMSFYKGWLVFNANGMTSEE